MTELVDLTIAEAGAGLARREMSAVELTEATLQRIEAAEPVIHAYALVLAERARRDARQADRELAQGRRRGPLHGIPIGVKDLCYTRDAPTEAGSRAMAGFVPLYDATVVTKLRAAGAVIVGKTVTHEFAYGVNTPPTRNPWNPACYPGGSSAGSGAAVAARSAFGAIGTDTGGSIREPATLNGIVGLKPTYGRVSRYGIVPLSPSLDHAGPLTRTVEDCALLLAAIAGYDPQDIGSVDEPVPDYLRGLEDGVAGLTIGVERGYFFGDGVQDEVRAAVDAVIAELAEAGAAIVEVSIPELRLMNAVGVTILLADASACNRRVLRERGADLDPNTRIMFELGELVPAPHYIRALQARRLVRAGVRNTFEAYRLDALLGPTSPSPTVPVTETGPGGEAGQDPLAEGLDFMIPANVTGMPAISAPCGFSQAGLPIGFQLFGRPFAESTLFRIVRAYERNHDWYACTPAL